MPSVLVTGSSRGLGLEFVRQYAAEAWRVYACARRPNASKPLVEIAEASNRLVSLHPLDVVSHPAIDALRRELMNEPIDLLLNSAAIAGQEPQAFGLVDYANRTNVLRINVMAPLKMAETFLDNVAASEKRTIAIMSSRMVSISETASGYYPYSSSKAAVNMIGRPLAFDLEPRDIAVVLDQSRLGADRLGRRERAPDRRVRRRGDARIGRTNHGVRFRAVFQQRRFEMSVVI